MDREKLPLPTTARGAATRKRLLRAAETEIGENSFAKTSVAAIVARAGVAQGTFYLYFPTKEDVLRELVRDMGRRLRRALSEATRELRSRVEVERVGLRAFVDFSLENQNLYRVVMESQFVDESIYREYYQTLASAYAERLKSAQQDGEIRRGDPDAQAWALMGVAHFLGLRYAIWERRTPPQSVLETTHAMLFGGLATAEPESAAAEPSGVLGA